MTHIKVDCLRVIAEVTLAEDGEEAKRLLQMMRDEAKVSGLVDQFPWMPFIVQEAHHCGSEITFTLRMVGREK